MLRRIGYVVVFVRFDAPPTKQSRGGILTHFFDPDDNMWSLVEHRPDAP